MDEFEVEQVIGVVVQGEEVSYWVKWAGYAYEESTCEPAHHLANAAFRVLTFHHFLHVIGPTHTVYANNTWMAFILPHNATMVPTFEPEEEEEPEEDKVDSDTDTDTDVEEPDNPADADYITESEELSDAD